MCIRSQPPWHCTTFSNAGKHDGTCDQEGTGLLAMKSMDYIAFRKPVIVAEWKCFLAIATGISTVWYRNWKVLAINVDCVEHHGLGNATALQTMVLDGHHG